MQRARHPALLLQLEQSPSYYRTLTHKLHWAGSLSGSVVRLAGTSSSAPLLARAMLDNL